MDRVTRFLLSTLGSVLIAISACGVCMAQQSDKPTTITLSGVTSTTVVSGAVITLPNNPLEAQKNDDVIVLSGVATTARIADPEERVVFNGRVMRMADYVAAVSSSTEAVQHLHTQEMRNREKDQPTPQLKQKN